MIVVAAGLVVRDGKILIARRPEGKHQGGKWEFPGGKLEAGESPEEALVRELREEMDIETCTGRVREVKFFRYPDRNVLLLFYWSSIVSGEPKCIECGDFAWVSFAELPDYDFAPADAELIQELSREGIQ